MRWYDHPRIGGSQGLGAIAYTGPYDRKRSLPLEATVNILIPLLQKNRHALANILGGTAAKLYGLDNIEYSQLSEVIPHLRELRKLLGDGPLALVVDTSFLPVVAADDWERSQLRAASRPTVVAPEWVTFIRGSGTDGVTVPDDNIREEKVSLFSRAEDGTITTVNIRAAENVGGGPSVSVGISGTLQHGHSGSGSHCRLPVRGNCDRGYCGTCELRQVERGLVCRCKDE